MATFNTTALSNLLKDDWLPVIINDINRKAWLYDLMRKSTEPFRAGNNWYVRFQTGLNQSFGWSDEGIALPPAANPTFDRFTITPKQAYACGEITAFAIAAGAGDLNSMKDSLLLLKDSLVIGATKNMNRAMYGDGTGYIGKVTATNGSTTITFDATGNKGLLTRYIDEGMYLIVHNGSDNTVRGACTVSSINRTTMVVTVDTVPGSTAQDDYVALGLQGGASSYNRAIMGLDGHVDDGTNVATYQGITRSATPRANASVLGNSGTSEPLTTSMIEQLCLQRVVKGDKQDNDPAALFMDVGLRTKFIELFQNQIRMVPMKIEGGTDKELLSYNGKRVQVDVDCPYHTMFYISPEDFAYHVLTDWTFQEFGGGDVLTLKQATNQTHTFILFLYSFLNTSCNKPTSQARRDDISQDIINPV